MLDGLRPISRGMTLRRFFKACHDRGLGPGVAALFVLLAVGPVGVALSGQKPRPAPTTSAPLAEVVQRAGCKLSEFDSDPRSNPPVDGRVDERVSALDG